MAPAKYPNLSLRCHQIGYGLLFISTLIFAVAVAHDLYWLPHSIISFCLGIAAVNTASLIHPPQLSKDVTRNVETIPVDWQSLVAGKVMPYGQQTTAQVGVSEAHFEKYLAKYFGEYLQPGYEFKIDENHCYSSDFTLILTKGISLIVEIDEPYDGKSKLPHHCNDDGKDDRRDEFFIKGNWVVIRFSEYQVCADPIACCYAIAQTLDSLDLTSNLSRNFKGVKDLPRDRRWNTRQATQMARRDYRLGYLEKYGVYQQGAKQSKSIGLNRKSSTPVLK